MNLETRNTARLGIWTQDGKTACAASLLTLDGEVVTGIVSIAGQGLWGVVSEALDALAYTKMRHLLMICNDAGAAGQFQYPVCIPQPERTEYKIGKYKEVHSVPSGGCNYMWNIIRHTCKYQAWSMVSSQRIIVSQQLWLHNFKEG